MKDFREMQVWNKGHKLALEIYKLTAGFPREEFMDYPARLEGLLFPYRLISLRVVAEEALKS